MRKISIKNFELVAGGFGPVGAAVGAATGAVGYVAERMAAGEEADLGDLAATAGIGAATGFVSGPLGANALRTGAAAVVGLNGAFYGGLAAGSVNRMGKNNPKDNGRDRTGINYCGTNYQ